MNIRLDMLSWHAASIKFSQVFNYFLPIYHNEEYSFVLDSYEVTGEKRMKKELKKEKDMLFMKRQ